MIFMHLVPLSKIARQMETSMSETTDKPIHFRCGSRIHPIIWAGFGFVVTSVVSAVFLGAFFGNNHPQLVSYVALSVAFLIPALICFWPRPRFARRITIDSGGITATVRGGRTISIRPQDLLIISAEPTMDWESASTNPWGRMYLRGGSFWIGLKLHNADAPDCYRQIIRRFPHVLGIPGKGDIDLPAIQDPTDLSRWIDTVRRLSKREIRRQMFLNLLNSFLLASFAGIFILGLIMSVVQGHPQLTGIGVLCLLVTGALGGSTAFAIETVRRARLLRRVQQELNHAEGELKNLV
jgi:hypothetical protein